MIGSFFSRILSTLVPVEVPKSDANVGIVGLAGESFLYMAEIVRRSKNAKALDLENRMKSVSFDLPSGKKAKFELYGVPLYGGRSFDAFTNVDYHKFDTLLLHYGKYVYSMESDHILTKLKASGMKHLRIVIILTSSNSDKEDVPKLIEKYGKYFRSLSFINNIYPDEVNGLKFDDPPLSTYLRTKVDEFLSLVDE